MKYKGRSLFILCGMLLFLTACSNSLPAAGVPASGPALPSGGENDAADPEYAEYSGYQFTGKDHRGGTLTVTIISIADGKMDWTFIDSSEGHTLYQVQKETVLQDMKAPFAIQGKDVENDGVTSDYQGTLELKDGKVTVTFDSGSQAVLDRTADGPYTVYTVREGDSAHSIAKAHGISTKDLCILNQLVILDAAKAHGYEFDDVTEYAKYLFPGMELLVPEK